MRNVQLRYQDPLDLIWIHCAKQLGMTVLRSQEVFASWDGVGTLTIGQQTTLDADDSLAQMIFHELCHFFVEGPESFPLPDWGLDISDPAQRVHEHACLRLQAALADQFGLRQFLAATTNFRSYYDRLPAEPLASATETGNDSEERAVELASEGWARATGSDGQPVTTALQQTADIARLVSHTADADSLWLTAQSKLASKSSPSEA